MSNWKVSSRSSFWVSCCCSVVDLLSSSCSIAIKFLVFLLQSLLISRIALSRKPQCHFLRIFSTFSSPAVWLCFRILKKCLRTSLCLSLMSESLLSFNLSRATENALEPVWSTGEISLVSEFSIRYSMVGRSFLKKRWSHTLWTMVWSSVDFLVLLITETYSIFEILHSVIAVKPSIVFGNKSILQHCVVITALLISTN